MKLHVLQITAYLVIIAAGMKAAAPVLNLVLLALLIGTSILPLILWMMKKGIPKSVSLLITIFLLVFIIGLTASALSVAVVGVAEKAPQYEQQFISLKNGTMEFLAGWGINVSEMISLQDFKSEKIISIATDFIAEIVSTFSNFTLIVLLIVFMLIDATDLRYKIYKGEREITPSHAKRMELGEQIRKYNSISAFTGGLTAVGNLILLLIMGVDFAFLWAFLSFLFSFIPNIGFILSIIAPAFIALVELGPTAAIIVIVGFIIINGIVENVIRPKYMGKELNISLTVIFLSLILWTWILGPIGAILAIPLTISAMKAWEIMFSEDIA